MFQKPAMLINVPVSPCSSVNICFIYFNILLDSLNYKIIFSNEFNTFICINIFFFNSNLLSDANIVILAFFNLCLKYCFKLLIFNVSVSVLFLRFLLAVSTYIKADLERN